jgi:2-methylcitrate dehydratase PrpD
VHTGTGEDTEARRLTRRGLLKGATCAIAAVAVTPGVAGAIATSRSAEIVGPEQGREPAAASSVTPVLCEYMAAASNRDLPAEASEKTKHHILDTLAAMVSGVDLPPAVVALKFAKAYGGSQVATVVGTNLQAGPLEAALANGLLAQSDETDDSHAPSHSHPGCGVVPAALASGELFGISGTHLLRAVALGYDVGTRSTMSLGGLPYQMASHRANHGIANNFGAAAAAGCAAELNAEQMRWVLSYAAQQASGVAAWQRDTQHVEKALVFGGMPARNGVTAALLISLGATGVHDILTGPDNFLIASTPNADPQVWIEKLGERYEVTRTNIKKWTVGSPIQAPLDALQTLLQQHSLTADRIQKVNVRVATSEAKTVNNREMPDICMQHMIAVMMLDKTISFQAAHDEPRMKDRTVLAQRAKVQLTPDEGLERLYPKRVAIVELALNDGTQLSQRVDAVRGTAENPMTREEVVAKCRELMDPFLGKEKTAKLIAAILDLEAIKNIRELRPLLQRN